MQFREESLFVLHVIVSYRSYEDKNLKQKSRKTSLHWLAYSAYFIYYTGSPTQRLGMVLPAEAC